MLEATENQIPKRLWWGIRILQNIWALFVWWTLAYILALTAFSGVFTADMMNQYWEVVDNLSGAEILVDISTWGEMSFLTTKDYSNVKWMVTTIYYNQEELSFDTWSIVSDYPIDIFTEDNTIKAFISITWDILNNTKLVSLKYSWQDARWTQTKSVFITEADFGGELEDLIVFTNTPKNPNWYNSIRE